MPNPLTEARRLGDLVKREVDPDLCRKRVTFKSGFGSVLFGTVMGIITASKKWAPYDPTANDGTEVAAGVALGPAAPGALPGPVDTTADAAGIVLRSLGVVSSDGLVWGANVTTGNHKTAAAGHLEALHLLVIDPA